MFGSRGRADPLLNTSGWRKVRDYWISKRLPCQAPRCHLPGRPIDYDGPYWVRTRSGSTTINPYAFHCGHVVARRDAYRLGWNEQQINSVENTRPEHARCSVKAGARIGRRVQSRRREANTAMNAHRW